MENNNKTVAEVCAKLKEVANGQNVSNDGLVVEISQEEIWDACDRIEAAHKREVDRNLKATSVWVKKADALRDKLCASEREVAELRECLKEAIDLKCKCCGYIVYKEDADISKPMSFTGESECGKIDGACFVQRWRKTLERANHEGK